MILFPHPILQALCEGVIEFDFNCGLGYQRPFPVVCSGSRFLKGLGVEAYKHASEGCNAVDPWEV